MILFYDCETFSEVPIKNGTAVYAAAAEIIVEQWAIDDGPVQVADRTAGQPGPFAVYDPTDFDEIVIQNSYFDRSVLAANGVDIPIRLITDTMVQALSHGLPGALGKLCEIFKVPIDLAKDKAGKQLIQLFCKPGPKNRLIRRATRETHPVEWARFLDYAAGDIHSMRHLHKVMPRWNYPARQSNRVREHELWQLDQRINDRGFKVDVELAEAAIQTVALAKKGMDAATLDQTLGEVSSTSKRDQLLKHLLEFYGVALPDMQKGTLERRLNDETLPWAVRELIAMRLQVSTTSNSKYVSLLKGVSADGRLRGTLQFAGAARTGRWGGRLFQPQNLPRPDMDADDILLGIDAMKAGSAHLVYDEPIKLASNAIRGAVVAEEGRKLVISDLSNIEGRMLAWLAGEEWKLKAFADYDRGIGHDLYKITAGSILRKPPENVTKDERQSTGKVPELACGYQGAVGAFSTMAALYGLDLPLHTVYEIVRLWRATNSKIVELWREMQDAAERAIRTPKVTCQAGEHIAFERSGPWLRMELPSGRVLCYAAPAMIEDPRRPGSMTISYMGLNSYTRKWERLTTYGGKLVENATQAAARDVLAYNMPRIEAADYPIVLTVHDEVITEPLDTSEFSADNLSSLLATLPDWADARLPLAAGGFETYRYRKD
jgi:DNA polymerase